MASVAGVAGGNLGREFGKALGEAEATKLGLQGDEKAEFINMYQQTLATIGGGLGGLVGGTAAGQTGTSLAATATYAGSTANAVDLNNRQLHEKEKKDLKELQKWKSSDEQARLADAACALTKCADGLSDENPEKAARFEQQARGAKYTEEQAMLNAKGLFTYSLTNYVDDGVARAADRARLEIQSAARGAYNLGYAVLKHGPNGVPMGPGDLPSCLVSCDHLPRRSWPLFRAKAMLGELIAGSAVQAFTHSRSN